MSRLPVFNLPELFCWTFKTDELLVRYLGTGVRWLELAVHVPEVTKMDGNLLRKRFSRRFHLPWLVHQP